MESLGQHEQDCLFEDDTAPNQVLIGGGAGGGGGGGEGGGGGKGGGGEGRLEHNSRC